MFRDIEGRRIKRGRAAAAFAWTAAALLGGWPAHAQRRRGEPEANPSFQQQLKSEDGGGGAPLSDVETSIESTAPSPMPSIDDRSSEPRPIQSVTIGAAPASRPAASSAPAPLDTRVTVRVKGAPLATFLDTISAQAKVNFIITEGLEQKRVTAFLQNVTVREALQVLLEIKGLTYQQIGKSNTYVVTQRSKQAENLITRIYNLSFVPLIPLKEDEETKGANEAAGGGGMGGQNKPCSRKNTKVAVARVICTVLSRSGDIELEPRTNALIVTDIPEVFPQVEQIIAELDKKSPQIMIEAQIVEIDSNRTRELGFEWGGANGELASFTAGARDTSFPLNFRGDVSQTKFFDPLAPTGGIISSLGGAGGSSGATSNPATPTNTATTNGASGTTIAGLVNTGLMKTSVLDLTSLKITLRALVQRSEARFLGKPKVLTLNNQQAEIHIKNEEALSFKTSSNQSASGSNAGTEPERKETGVSLKVRPQVNKEGYITMHLQPKFVDITEASISRADNRVFNTIERSAQTLVRVKNGQTLVLGGLLRSTETKVVRKVPFFGYIPIIGWLFTSSSNRRNNSDLVIFITPTIVSD